MVCFAVPQLEVLHQAMENHQRSLEPSGLVGKSADQGDRPTCPWRPSGPSFWGCFVALLVRSRSLRRLFLKSLREVLLHRAKWITLAGFWRNVRDYLLVGHGLMMVGCWWIVMEVFGE